MTSSSARRAALRCGTAGRCAAGGVCAPARPIPVRQPDHACGTPMACVSSSPPAGARLSRLAEQCSELSVRSPHVFHARFRAVRGRPRSEAQRRPPVGAGVSEPLAFQQGDSLDARREQHRKLQNAAATPRYAGSAGSYAQAGRRSRKSSPPPTSIPSRSTDQIGWSASAPSPRCR